MDFLADAIKLTTPTIIILAIAIQLIIFLYLANRLAGSYPAHKNTLYAGSIILFALSLYPYFYFAYSGEAFIFLIRSLISIPLIFFIPGYLTYNAFIKERTGLNTVEVLFVQVIGSVLASGWIGLVLAEIGIFSLTNLTILLFIACCIIKVKYNVKLGLLDRDITIDRATILMIIISVVAITLFFHPYPWILGNLDQGVYLNTGVNIAKTGSILIHDNGLDSLDSGLIGRIFYVFYHGHASRLPYYLGTQYPGFYITNIDSGIVVPQFFYLWPTWIAIFYSIFGLKIGLYVTPFFALLSMLGIYMAGKTLFNKNVGLMASLLLSINFAFIWYSREPMSEMLTMLFVFSGIFLFILFIRHPSQRYFGVLSALSIGQIFLVRIDTLYLLIPFILYFGYLRLCGKLKKEHWYFIIPLLLICAHASATAGLISLPYTVDTFRKSFAIVRDLIDMSPLTVLAGAIIFLALLAVMEKYKGYFTIKAGQVEKYIPHLKHAMAILLLSGVLFAYFMRPSGDISSDSYNLVKLSWYMAGLLGVLFATAGFILIMYEKRFNETFPFLLIFLIYAVFYLNSSQIDTWHPWWVRRYLPIVIPAAILCIAYLIDRVHGLSIKIPRINVNISVFLIIFMVASFTAADYKTLTFSQFGNAMDDVDSISKLIDSNSIVLYKSNAYSEMIALPLHYIYGYDMVSAYITDASVEQMSEWLNENRSIYLLDLTGFSNANDDGQIVKYTVDWPVLQYAYLTGPLSIYVPGGPRTDHYTYAFRILRNASDLQNMTFLYISDKGWSEIICWDKTPTLWYINNGSLIIYSMNDKHANLTFDVKSPDTNRTLLTSFNGHIVGEEDVNTEYRKVNIPVKLNKGINTVGFHPKEGTGRPAGRESKDEEDPCFSFQNISIGC